MRCSPLCGSSKTAPRISIFSVAMGADYSFNVKNIETHACAFLRLNISAIGTVIVQYFSWLELTDKLAQFSSFLKNIICLLAQILTFKPNTFFWSKFFLRRPKNWWNLHLRCYVLSKHQIWGRYFVKYCDFLKKHWL